MKKLSLAIIALLPFTSLANQYYLNMETGIAFNKVTDNTFTGKSYKNKSLSIKDTGYFGIGFGKHINDNLRIDLGFNYMPKANITNKATEIIKDDKFKDSIFSTNISSYGIMANIYYDFINFDEKIKPYITAGIGFSMNEIEKTDVISDDDLDKKIISYKSSGGTYSNFAWKVGAGINYQLNDKIQIGFGYSLYNRGKAKENINNFIYNDSEKSYIPFNKQLLMYKNLFSHMFLINAKVKL